MSTRPDPLARPGSPDRVFYATGVLLDAQDFTDEQLYHRGRLARALAYLHGVGTVAGLQVVWEAAVAPGTDATLPQGRAEQLRVEAGLALDRLGRLIEVPRDACLRLQRWYEGERASDLRQGLHGPPYNGVVADVFIRFVPCERGKTPAFASGPFDALDAVAPSRLRDGYRLDLVVRKEADPPLPQDPWPDLDALPDAASRRAALHQAILGAWREGTAWRDEHGLVPLVEHASGQDTTAVFLARVVLPAVAAPDANAPPVRTPGAPVTVDNDRRLFVYTAAALARWLGI